jgi:guanylate kinase
MLQQSATLQQQPSGNPGTTTMTTALGPAGTLVDRSFATIARKSVATHPDASALEPILVALNGPNGVGKTTVVQIAERSGFDVAFVQKYGTRPLRPGAVANGFLLSPEEFARRCEDPGFWKFNVGSDKWGFYIDELRSTVAQHRITLITLPNPGFNRRLQRALVGVRFVSVFIYADEARRAVRIANDTATVETPAYRHATAPRLLARYRRAPFVHDHVLLNLFSRGTFERHVKALLQLYNAPQHESRTVRDQLERSNQECFV